MLKVSMENTFKGEDVSDNEDDIKRCTTQSPFCRGKVRQVSMQEHSMYARGYCVCMDKA